MTDRRDNDKCPSCGERENWYPQAVPTGRTISQSGRLVAELRLHGSAGHCLDCGHLVEPST